ncbi:MAG: adenosine deaminase [Bacteroidetes bacterium]|nr:adenosine deaminase [Bacteroidota bacterium]
MEINKSILSFIREIPKAELHVHIEGTLEPELFFRIAERNKIPLKYPSAEALRKAYRFNNLEEFLQLYHESTMALKEERDFYDMTMAYLQNAHRQNILHTEIIIQTQTYTARGISISTVLNGFHQAIQDARATLGISSKLMLCFLRHLGVSSAIEAFELAIPHKEKIVAIGLASTELGHQPSKFKPLFDKAREQGFKTISHAGEEGPPEYIWETIDILKVDRIDHGNRSMEDGQLIAELAKRKIPLTLCPLSNLRLGIIKTLENYPVRNMLEKGMVPTINSDDPAYFGGNVNENFQALHEAIRLSKEEIYQLAQNSFKASFISEAEKEHFLNQLEVFRSNW